tara:strand:+ start:449 stop:715 length:267 start_codon:yes stop_codon:yes gene_type:complete
MVYSSSYCDAYYSPFFAVFYLYALRIKLIAIINILCSYFVLIAILSKYCIVLLLAALYFVFINKKLSYSVADMGENGKKYYEENASIT